MKQRQIRRSPVESVRCEKHPECWTSHCWEWDEADGGSIESSEPVFLTTCDRCDADRLDEEADDFDNDGEPDLGNRLRRQADELRAKAPFVCKNCLKGDHASHDNHQKFKVEGPKDYDVFDCKVTTPDNKKQCTCRATWPKVDL